MKVNSRDLHLGVEFSSCDPGDLDLGVEQVFKDARIVAVHRRIYITAIHQNLQIRDARIRTSSQFGSSDHTMNDHPNRVVLGADQLIEACQHGLRQGAVANHSDAIRDDNGAETLTHLSPHQDAIPWNEPSAVGRQHKNGRISILNEQNVFIPRKVSDCCLKGNRQRLAGFRIAECVNGAQVGQRRGLRRPGRQAPVQDHRNCENQSLHRIESFRTVTALSVL